MKRKIKEQHIAAPFFKKADIFDKKIQISEYIYVHAKIPAAFSGKRIVQISDLHSEDFSHHTRSLESCITACRPDIIVITGDLIDRRHFDLCVAQRLIKSAVRIAPVYFVPGNHEAWCKRYDEVKEMLLAEGVNVLENRQVSWTIGEESIILAGALDPGFLSAKRQRKIIDGAYTKQIFHLMTEKGFVILLAHRPEYAELYRSAGAGLTFCGHAHGGQIRFSFAKDGLFAPEQGIFPFYTNGIYEQDGAAMVVSRGLGKSLFPWRVGNPPEVVCVTLKCE